MIDLTPYLADPEVRSLLALSVYPAPGRLERALARYRTHGHMLLGYEEDEVLLGCIGLDFTHSTILNLGVRHDARGRGTGRALVMGAVGFFGLNRLEAETDGSAVGFYRRCGFEVVPLGETYPGVVRFRCLLDRSTPAGEATLALSKHGPLGLLDLYAQQAPARLSNRS